MKFERLIWALLLLPLALSCSEDDFSPSGTSGSTDPYVPGHREAVEQVRNVMIMVSGGHNSLSGYLTDDLYEMAGSACADWEIAFELRLKRSRYVRIYADVLVITEDRVFSMEFKMKKALDPGEVLQAAKYCPYLEIMFPEKETDPAEMIQKLTSSGVFRTLSVIIMASVSVMLFVLSYFIGLPGYIRQIGKGEEE